MDCYRVNVASLNLRKSASDFSEASIIVALPRGQIVTKLSESDQPSWWRVRTEFQGKSHTGFLNSKFMESAPEQPSVDAKREKIQISDEAVLTIISFEGMDQPAKWPGENSGITIGHGYDLAYYSHKEFMSDWGGHLSREHLTLLGTAIGRRGLEAKGLAPRFTGISIRADAAEKVFHTCTLPKHKQATLNAFPGVTALPPDAQGALVSLVFNRGGQMDGDRRREMREIRDAIANASLSTAEKLKRIAASLRSMERLWPNLSGLRKRRRDEANLVEKAIT